MTAERAYNFSHPTEQTPEVPKQSGGEQVTSIDSLFFRRFADFCGYEGIDVSRPMGPIHQPLMAEQGRRFIVGSIIEEVQNGEAKLLPAATTEGQLVLYYQQNDVSTTSPARQKQQKEFRKQHIDLALAQRRNFEEINYADHLLKGALYAKNWIVARSMADLLTAYGMSLKRLGLQAGRTALQQPRH